MRATIDLACLTIIAFTVFTLIYTANHLLNRAEEIEREERVVAPAPWAVIACDDFQKDRSRCGLVRINHKE